MNKQQAKRNAHDLVMREMQSFQSNCDSFEQFVDDPRDAPKLEAAFDEILRYHRRK